MMTTASDLTDIRFIGGIPSTLTLLDEMRQSTQAGEQLGCWTTSISPYLAIVATAVRVRPGQPLQLQLAEIGSVRGHAARLVQGGVAMNFELDEPNRVRLAGKIAWYRKRVLFSQADRREYKRRLPANPESVLLLADGARKPCRILDVSCSGAAVEASVLPEIGTPLALGQVVGRVVRHIPETGFAMQFLIIQEEDTLDEMVHPMPPSARTN